MAQSLKFKRGSDVNFASQTLEAGEPAFILDTGKLYIGNGTDKILINPDIAATASAATKLETPRTITIGGEVTGSVSFDGSQDVTITTQVVDNAHLHTTANVTGLDAALTAKAPLASPALTGTPTVPTATAGTNTTQAASTAFVTSAVSTAVAGNVASATKLATARTLSTTGDATGSASFDGTANAAIALTLANSGVTAGTYTKVTVDAKGRTTVGANLAASDVPTLTLAKISDAGTAASKNTGVASGNVPILDANGKLDTAVLPGLALTTTNVVAAEAAMLALTAEPGDLAVRTDIKKTYVLKTAGASTLANWQELLTPTDVVTSVAGKTGVVTLTSTDVGLGNVTNESKATMFTSAALTGTPTAPTPTAGDNDTSIATTAFVTGAVSTAVAGNVASATKLQTARTISLTGDVTGSVSFDGTGNAAIAATVADDSHNHVIANVDNLQTALDGKTPFSTLSGTTAATAGWYRVGTSAVDIGSNSGLFKVDFSGTGVKGSTLFRASCHDGVASGSAINQLGFTSTATTLGLTQVRVVYHTTYTANYAYVEVYNPTALAITYTVDLIDTTGWSLVAPSTAGSIPSGYVAKTLTLDVGVVSMEDVTAGRQLVSNVATGAAPLVVASSTLVSNLNAQYLNGQAGSYYAPLASPALTGTPTAPTPTAGDNDTSIATTAFVTTAVANKTTITGNAGTATKLATARTITLAGDATGSVSFDGSANVSITVAVAVIDGGTF